MESALFRYVGLALLVISQTVFATEKIVVGICGGTGSGKTTLAQKIKASFSERAVLLHQDAYYKEFVNLSPEERAKINFDHPDAIDFPLLHQHILDLKNDLPVEEPRYNFCTHARDPSTEQLLPAQIIIVEGILLFAVPEIYDLIDMKIFIDTDDDIRLLRRIERDINERARDLKGIGDQYTRTVKPMHDRFVRPSKEKADVIVPQGGENPVALSVILSMLREALDKAVER